MDDKSIVEMAVLAGEIMLRSGAETYRVEDTMKHILNTGNTETAEALVMLTGIVATAEDPGMQPLTVMRRVNGRGTNIYRIIAVNDISRQYCSGKISLEEAYDTLRNLERRQYSTAVYNIATVLVPMGFAPLWGGGLKEVAASAVVGGVLALIMTAGKRVRAGGFFLNAVCAAGTTAASILIRCLYPSLNVDTLIISGLMPLVPGMAVTNAVRDTLRHDFISGGARVLEAFMTAAAIALGAGAGMLFMQLLGPGGGFL